MRALVLGGSRFVGKHLVAELLGRGYEVSALNRGRTPAEFPPEVRRLFADRTRPDEVRQALASEEFDVVFDVSAYTPETLQPAVECLAGRVGRYVFTSSTAVYRPPDMLPVSEDFPLHHDSARRYALDKIACEAYLMGLWRRDRFPVTIIRPPMVMGPHNAIPTRDQWFFARLRRNRPQLVPGDGLALLHFVHVDDLARAFVDSANTGATLGQAYHVAGRDMVTVAGYVRLVGEAVGATPRTVHVPPERMPEPRPAWCPYDADLSVVYTWEKARHDFGYEPRHGTRSIVSDTYGWYLQAGVDNQPWDFTQEDALLRELGVKG